MTAPVPAATPEEVGLSSAGLAKVDAYLQALVDEGRIPGAATLVARHGKICHVGAVGWQDIGCGLPARADGLYRIFSMTKPVTAAAMMILWDRGLWQFDDPIAKHLPEFADLEVLAGTGDDGSLRLEAAAHPPTLRELVTHSAGFGYGLALSDPTDPIVIAYREQGVWEAGDLREMMARLARCPLGYQPGRSWRYSLGMEIEGALIERLTGQSLAAFLRETIFEPLGMTDTAFFTPPAKTDRLATLYFRMGDNPLAEIPNPLRPDYDAEPKLATGGGGLVSTLGDYARFAQMLLNGGGLGDERLMSAGAVRQMMTNHLPDALMRQGFVAGHQRIRPGFGMGVNGVVFTDPALAGVPVGRGTYHWDGAAGTWFWVDPENDLLFVGMTQFLSYGAPPIQESTQRLIGEALGGSSGE